MSTSQERINRAAELEAQVLAMPRLRFICERDWITGPNIYAIGFLWDRNIQAEPGEFIYRRRFLLRLKFRIWFERW